MEVNIYKTRISDTELLDIFPEAKEIIPEKIKEWEQSKKRLLNVIKKKLKIIKEKSASENQWFWREWVKVNEGEELLKIDNHIARLKGIVLISEDKTPNGWITEDKIQRALEFPIQNLINQPLRKIGKTLVGLCPLHNEKHASFYIYPETNRCWCFGCSQGGNTINLIKLMRGYSFKEAMQYLIGKI